MYLFGFIDIKYPKPSAAGARNIEFNLKVHFVKFGDVVYVTFNMEKFSSENVISAASFEMVREKLSGLTLK